jgi:glycosyltransferase involved in cell wall biosynthesis
VTPLIASRFPAHKTVMVQNFPIPGELTPAHALPYASRPPLVAYVGKLEGVRGAREMVAAMAHVPQSADAQLALAGIFEPKTLQSELRATAGWERVQPMGWLTRPEIGTLLGRARVGLVLLHPVDNYLDAQPNKLFEYMAAGIPVVASDFPGWRRLIEECCCGILVDPLSPVEIADAIAWLLARPEEAAAMGRRGQAAVRERFSWDVEAGTLLALYRDLLRA